MTIGVILAGGLARRMGGGDKGMRLVGGQTVLARVLERLSPQVARVIINANGDPARFAPLGLPVVADTMPGNPGPLAGVLAGLDWAAANAPEAGWIVTVPGDAPFLPRDLVRRLHEARGQAEMACASSGGRTHPVIALWPLALRDDLRRALAAGSNKVGAFTERHGAALAEWPAEPVDPFFNVNTPEDLEAADLLAATHAP
ncbi:MAG TPA: molybdenum cofactor guanylyltransferase MobA [Acetobacteraceae bacterium]|nr:molybdenum cofactor guanylyltransferase MobA [Acetobacteraceae bacterium]